ncbi:hypothetical protein LTR08_005088 [Meristemomyces frigidus]|nr:hypothetical protein LTR08_005088 [Meristemomyces frigidus]
MAPSTSAPPKPKIIGLYGIPGTGKSYLADQLRKRLDTAQFTFFEGSEVISALIPGGLAAFKSAPDHAKAAWRHQAITSIRQECVASETVGIVNGHFILGVDADNAGSSVFTSADAETFTHVIYLDLSSDQLREWQDDEKRELRDLCRKHDILFALIQPAEVDRIVELLVDFRDHDDTHNLTQAKKVLDGVVFADGKDSLETVLEFDADKTLAAEDAGTLLWDQIGREHTLKDLFSSPLGYSYTAFRQATLLCEGAVADNVQYEAVCEAVAARIEMRREFANLMRKAKEHEHVGVVVVTCGYRLVWEKVLARAGLSWVKVIGGGRLADSFVVTGGVKSDLVAYMHDKLHLYVWVFGDGPLDLDMLGKADQAVVVVGDEGSRSKSMETQLAGAIRETGLRARQVLFPSTTLPRLDFNQLPLLQLDGSLENRLFNRSLQIFHATDKPATKLLMTPTRDSALAGPALRDAHRRIGWYLATEYLTLPDVIGLEAYTMTSVQSKPIEGHQLLGGAKTTIIPLMRGGEPLAFGVSDAFPLAMFLHAKEVSDVKASHLAGQTTVVLVDSVINSGKSVGEFVYRIRELQPAIHIVVVASVVQKAVVEDRSRFRLVLRGGGQVTLVALRLSANKFTGSGTTDTGNRLFNTTHLPNASSGGETDSAFAREWRRLGSAPCLEEEV